MPDIRGQIAIILEGPPSRKWAQTVYFCSGFDDFET